MSKKKKCCKGRFQLTRDKYKELKKCDHKTMEEKMNEVFEKGKAFGAQTATKTFPLDSVMERIASIPGIGPVKQDAIKQQIVEALQQS